MPHIQSGSPVSTRVQFEQWVAFPLEQVFLFFANPENLVRIMPSSTGARIEELCLVAPTGVSLDLQATSKLAGVGSEIVASVRVFPSLPFRANWIAQITEFEWNHHFADIQKKGPFKRFHHRHEMAAEIRNGIAGTIVRDTIEYEVGLGWLGAAADTLLVSRELHRTFRYRQRRLEELLAAG